MIFAIPLGAVKTAYYLKNRLGNTKASQSNPRNGQYLELIDEEVDHSNEIISDLMSFASVGSPSLSPTNISEGIEKALPTIKIRENVRVVKQFDTALPAVMAEGAQLYRVFMNLANNAQDAMPVGGELAIDIRRKMVSWQWRLATPVRGSATKIRKKYSSRRSPPKKTAPGWVCPFVSSS